VTPNPDALVHVGVDREGSPVYLDFLEAVDAPTLLRTVRLFLAGYEGMAGGGPPVRRRRPAPDPGTVEHLLRAVEVVTPRLSSWLAPRGPRRRAMSA